MGNPKYYGFLGGHYAEETGSKITFCATKVELERWWALDGKKAKRAVLLRDMDDYGTSDVSFLLKSDNEIAELRYSL